MHTYFDRASSVEEIQHSLQQLVKELLATFAPQRAAVLRQEETVDLCLLAELSYADVKQHEHPVRLLSGLCRLLVKAGERKFLQYALALSHTLYAFQCRHRESWYIAALYRGLAQIGLGFTQLGVKNVSNGLAGHAHFTLMAVDRALGYWALCSAAIANRNLKLAVNFTQQWRQAARAGNLKQETVRSGIAHYLLALVMGDLSVCPHSIDGLLSKTTPAWEPIVHELDAWTRAMQSGVSLAASPLAEPFPLFLGLAWLPSETSLPEAEPLPSSHFARLCEIRRRFCYPQAIASLSAEQIEHYANWLALWELPRPLYDFETILRNKAIDRNLRYVMTRLLGRQVLETVTQKTALDPEVATQHDAVILVMDVRKYSALSEHRTPGEIFDLLNPIFKMMHEELERTDGTILEFVGDCIIIVWNTFKKQQTRMAEILFCTMQALNRIRMHNALSSQAGLPEIRVGVGLHTGPVALGYLGGLPRCHLTVLGNTINLAARLESSSKEFPAEMIVSESCFEGGSSDVWKEPSRVNFSVRDLGEHAMRNIERPVHLYGLSPLLRSWVDFVPMGFVAWPEQGVVYLDTGNSGEPGIIDHHHRSHTEHSACELLLAHPELLLEHLKDIPPVQREFRVHHAPDLDCASTLYAAYELLEKDPRLDLLRRLAAYISRIDQGRVPQPEYLHDSLLGVCIAHQKLVRERLGGDLTDFHLLEAELRVIDAAMYLLETQVGEGDFASIFQRQPDWFAEERRLIRQDRSQYQEDVRQRSHTYRARVNGVETPVIGLWLDHPQSVFFTLWGRNDPDAPGGKGYQFLVVDWSQPGKNRFILSVDPDAGTNLEGLGQLLERHETAKRAQLGKKRPIHPIRYPADNSDPWYFGQGHQYTIIDAPWEGTVLTAEEAQRIHEHWKNGWYGRQSEFLAFYEEKA